MRNRRYYNDLFSSIIGIVLILGSISFYVFMISIMQAPDDIPAGVVISTIFVPLIIVCAIAILKTCFFDWWYLSDHEIHYKTIFKKTVININEIEEVTIETVNYLDGCGTPAYIIRSGKKRIIIFIRKKEKFYDLEDVLRDFLDK